MSSMAHSSPEQKQSRDLPLMTAADWSAVTSAEMIKILLTLKNGADAGDFPSNRMYIRPNRSPIRCGHVALICRANLRQRFRTSEDGRASIWPAVELEGWR